MSDTTDRMKEVARTVQAILPPHTGFIVLAFDFSDLLKPGHEGRLEYVSNAQRKDVIQAMKEFITKVGGDEWGKQLR